MGVEFTPRDVVDGGGVRRALRADAETREDDERDAGDDDFGGWMARGVRER